jgi:hypothetical protein
MTDTPSNLVRLDGYQADNWSGETPVAILNSAASLHEQIAYCWGLTNEMRVMADLLCSHEVADIKELAALFGCRLQPLEAVLKKLGSDTN